MKSKIRILGLVPVLLPLLMMQSCHTEEPDPFADNTFLVSSTLEYMRTKENMVTLLNYAAILYPEAAEIIPDVQSGVNVYSISYKTTFKGHDVTASGLIIIPSVPGPYPVLAYQNGCLLYTSPSPRD